MLVVKTFFYFFLWLGWAFKPQLGWVRFHHQRNWLLYPAYPRHYFSLRGLVHICIPHTGTPCGGRFAGRDLLVSRGTCLLASALSLCAFIIAQVWRFVKGFLHFFSISFTWTTATRKWFPSPLDPLIVSHFKGIVKRKIEIFSTFFRSDIVSTASPIGRYIHASVCVPSWQW